MMDQGIEMDWSAASNPLLRRMLQVLGRVQVFKESAREFYFEVLLSVFPCPVCAGRLRMEGPSRCVCDCGAVVDPTAEFQRSPCCDARLVRRTFHYGCSRCGQVVASRFLFDERVFDAEYFREQMRESRERRRERQEEIKRLLASSRSDALVLDGLAGLESVPGLVEDLDAFIGRATTSDLHGFAATNEYDFGRYRDVILSYLGGCSAMFSTLPAVSGDIRLDRARRFLTLVSLWQDRVVDLTQYGDDVLVERHEADAEG